MARQAVYFWKQIPLFRLLIPFITGILFQWYIGIAQLQLSILITICCIVLVLFYWVPSAVNYSWRWLQGAVISLLFFALGSLVTFNKDIRNNPGWVGHYYADTGVLLVTIKEPLVEKNKSYKAVGAIEALRINNTWQPVKGNMLLYFKKDTLMPRLQYGSQVIFKKKLQPILNSGNPGTFNYQRYSAFQNIYHQCYLTQQDYKITETNKAGWLRQWLFNIRFSVNASLKKYINGPKEQGVAEALLIGYRDDLDKNLVQAYSNTGVVHIIAISGLHLGMIYISLLSLFKLFKKQRWVKYAKPIIILLVLWTFSLVAGAAPSILRSAVMFSCLLIGEVLNKKSNIYNTLAASAFLLLCIDPFVLWNVGFQLSYAAVLSIVIFMQPIYKWLYFKNKLVDGIWKLNSVTIAAQILTLPIVCYHFHQFPNLFLITNFIAVPLASVILYGELFIVIIGKLFSPVAYILGYVVSKLLWIMNTVIEKVNELPFVVSGGIQVSVMQAVLLYLIIISFSLWLLRKTRLGLKTGLVFLLFWVGTRTMDFYNKTRQQKLIVYNIPQHTAIDFINGRNYQFAGDSIVLQDAFLQNFHLQPSRILNRIAPGPVPDVIAAYPFLMYKNKKIVVIDKPYRFNVPKKINVDMIVLSKNPNIYISHLNAAFNCKMYVFDASNPLWKINLWKKDCDSLHLRHYSTQEKGALQLDL